jgi:hypothetical protein
MSQSIFCEFKVQGPKYCQRREILKSSWPTKGEVNQEATKHCFTMQTEAGKRRWIE